MQDRERRIECGTHGEAWATLVCGHLAQNPRQRWVCAYPSEENPWPDAWCTACDHAYQKFGEWNEENEQVLDLKLACHFCYEERKGSSVAALMEVRSAAWQARFPDAVAALIAKHDLLDERFGFSQYKNWEWDQETCRIKLSIPDTPALEAMFQVVGSYSTKSDTWLWSWNFPGLEARTFEDMLKLRSLGEAEDFANLTVPKWPADEKDGWEMTAVAAQFLEAEGAYRLPSETGATFLLLRDINAVP